MGIFKVHNVNTEAESEAKTKVRLKLNIWNTVACVTPNHYKTNTYRITTECPSGTAVCWSTQWYGFESHCLFYFYNLLFLFKLFSRQVFSIGTVAAYSAK